MSEALQLELHRLDVKLAALRAEVRHCEQRQQEIEGALKRVCSELQIPLSPASAVKIITKAGVAEDWREQFG